MPATKLSNFTLHKVILPTSIGEKKITIYIKRESSFQDSPIVQFGFTPEGSTKRPINHIISLKQHETDSDLLKGTFCIEDDLSNIIEKEHHNYPGMDIKIAEGQTVALKISLLSAIQKNVEKPLKFDKSVKANVYMLKELSFIVPRPLRIALMGDSYAAGVGTGVYDISGPDNDPQAFRSSISGLERYISRLREDYRVDHINATYSGAQLLEGNEKTKWNGDFKYIGSSIISISNYSELEELDNAEQLPLETYNTEEGTQLKQVTQWLDEKPLDYVFMTIGGNDMYERKNGKSGLSKLINRVLGNIGKLNQRDYDRITLGKKTLKMALKLLEQHTQNHPLFKETQWILNTYPDITKNENGHYVDYTSISHLEMRRVYELVLEPLNDIIKEFCQKSTNSKFIANDVKANNPLIEYHGVTSTQPWFNDLSEVQEIKNKTIINIIESLLIPSRLINIIINAINKRLTNDKSEADDSINKSFHPNAIGQYEVYYKSLKKIFEKSYLDDIKSKEPSILTIDPHLPDLDAPHIPNLNALHQEFKPVNPQNLNLSREKR